MSRRATHKVDDPNRFKVLKKRCVTCPFSKNQTTVAADSLAEIKSFLRRSNRPFAYYVTTLGKYPIRWMPLGAIIGTVELVEIERVEAVVGVVIGHKEEAFGDYSPGRWAWQLANPVVFDEPRPWRGALGLWSTEA